MDDKAIMQAPVPTLTLDPAAQAQAQATAEPAEEKPVVAPAAIEDSLSAEELAAVDSFAKEIDVTDSAVVMQYGSAAQQKVSNFSETALSNVRTKDMGEVGEMMTDLIGQLKGFNEEEKGGLFGVFRRSAQKLSAMKAKYDKVESNVDRICDALEGHQITLMKDVATLDEMYKMNLSYFKELSMYILAGKRRLAELTETVLPELRAKAEKSGLPEDAQAANDYASALERFDKKLHDLELTRMVSIQMAPQIRLLQNNDTLMSEKIQSVMVNTIPLWKSQMVIALGLEHSRQAMQAQRAVTDMTNELLKKNADALKTATIETARESERGVVDMETLRHTNESLITTLDEVKKIQDEGRQKRREAEEELGRIEAELRSKLLEIKK